MPSPFPGMNPYFEQIDDWHDFHKEFLVTLRHQLVPRIGPGYFIPLKFRAEVQRSAEDIERIAFLEVRDCRDRELVTIIELLSPSNKRPGDNRSQYLSKRRQILRSDAHLVEIDLLRGWPPMPAEGRPAVDYSVLISRAGRRPVAEFWPIRLRDRMPVIPIPLKEGDPDSRVDLQAVLNQAYDRPAYEDFIYYGSPEPPLTAEDAEWAAQFLPRPV
jgi:hypothetical protein